MPEEMHQIAITGGKGGTGKSTFAILLASRLLKQGKKVVLYDADVECPNDYLLLNSPLEEGDPVFALYPEIDADKCTLCGKCVEKCRFNALYQLKDSPPELEKNMCNGCGLCWEVCPENAIKPVEEACGASYVSEITKDFFLITGKSDAGVEGTSSIVSEVRNRAVELANKVGADYLLVDTAAGTHCNVINGLLGSELAYVVTEPTPLGSHDSRQILKVLKIIGVKAEIVLNKEGVSSDSGIVELSKDLKTKIRYKIPYSEELVRAYSNGNLIGLDFIKEYLSEE